LCSHPPLPKKNRVKRDTPVFPGETSQLLGE
jgi:hypothetical protein